MTTEMSNQRWKDLIFGADGIWVQGSTRCLKSTVYQVPEVDGIPGGTAVSQVTGLPEQICGSSEFSQAVTARFLYA